MVESYSFLTEIVASDSAANLDIRAYTQKIKEELGRLEGHCLSDYLLVSEEVDTLSTDIDQTLSILDKIEGLVDKYQTHITSVSTQVKEVQKRSQQINTELTNQKNLEQISHSYLDAFVISQETITKLSKAEIDQDYLDLIQKFSDQLIRAKSGDLNHSEALTNEVLPELEKLKFLVCSRCRNFLISQMNNLQKPNSNFQIYQESVLLKWKGCVAFLKIHHVESYVELTEFYAEMMDHLYYKLLRNYFKDTSKLIQKAPSFSQEYLAHNLSPEDSSEILKTEARDEDQNLTKKRQVILENLTAQPIVAAISNQQQKFYYFEEVFRSCNKLVIDTVCKEFVFVLDFFDLKMAHMTQLFNKIFARAVNKYLKWLTDYECQMAPKVSSSSSQQNQSSETTSAPANNNQSGFLKSTWGAMMSSASSSVQANSGHDMHIGSASGLDTQALLLSIQLNEDFRRLMQQSFKIPVLDLYHDRVSQILWPKFTNLFQKYIDAVNNQFSGVVNQKQSDQSQKSKSESSLAVHPLVGKYVHFVSGVYQLVSGLTTSQDMVTHRLVQLKTAIINLLNRMATIQAPQPTNTSETILNEETNKLQQIFLMNNCAYIARCLGQIEQNGTSHAALLEDLGTFQLAEADAMESYVHLSLNDSFPALIQFSNYKKGQSQDVNVKQLEVASLDFAHYFKQKAEQIAKEIQTNISAEIAPMVGQKVMRAVCLKYSVLLELCKEKEPRLLQKMPSSNQVMLDLGNTGLKQQASMLL